jgi:hypothetical protein
MLGFKHIIIEDNRVYGLLYVGSNPTVVIFESFAQKSLHNDMIYVEPISSYILIQGTQIFTLKFIISHY